MKSVIIAIALLCLGTPAFATESSGEKFECIQETELVGSTRSLTLTQIEKSDQWLLEIYTQPVVPNAPKTLEVSSVLTVTTVEDVMFFLENREDNIQFNIYMDELYMTYLYMNGEKQAQYFNCEASY